MKPTKPTKPTKTAKRDTIPWFQLLGKTSGFLMILIILFLICRNDTRLEPENHNGPIVSDPEDQTPFSLANSSATTTESIDTLIKRLKQMKSPTTHQNKRDLFEETVGLNLILEETPIDNPSPVLSWTQDPRASHYTVTIDDSEQCTSPLYTTDVPVNRQKIPIFLENGTYWACISAISLSGESLSYTESPFVVEAEGVGPPEDFQGHLSSPHYGYFDPHLPRHDNIQEILGQHRDFFPRDPQDASPLPSQETVGFFRHFSLVSDPHDDWKVKLLIVDQRWNRVLLYSTYPVDQEALPDQVIGQKDFTEPSGQQPNVTGPLTLNRPSHASLCLDGRLLITDSGNHRVLVWKEIPKDFRVSPDFVIGQENFTSSTPGIGPSKLNQPVAAFCTPRGILVADSGNNRLLVFSPQDLKKARIVIGQDDFYTKTSRCSQSSVGRVEDLWIDADRLLVADTEHHRILMFTSFPTKNGERAQKVLGQPNFNQCQPNRGLSKDQVSNDTLYEPSGLAIRNGVLAVSDRKNKRILLFPWDLDFPSEAFDVLGQRDFGVPQPANKGGFTNLPFGLGDSPLHGVTFTKTGLWTIDQLYGRMVKLPLP